MLRLSSFVIAVAVTGCAPQEPPPASAPDVEPGLEPAEAQARAPAKKPARKKKPAPRGAQQALLDAHNQARKAHCAPALTWSAELARVAQGWADQLRRDGCKFEHSRTRYGENLAAGTSGHLGPDRVVGMWYEEVREYDFRRGGFAMETGHFTQVVWKATKRVGCGMTTCNGLDLWVCNYDPPGNVERGYKANVLPTSCRK